MLLNLTFPPHIKALWYVECCWIWPYFSTSKHFGIWSIVEPDLTSLYQNILICGVLLNLIFSPYIKVLECEEYCWIWGSSPYLIWENLRKLILFHIKVLWCGKYSDEKPNQIPINFHISKCFAMENVLNMKVHMVYIKVFIFLKKIQPGFYFNLNCIYYIRTFWCGKYFNKKSNMNSKIIFKKMHNNTLDLYLLYANDIFLTQIDLIKSTCSLAPAPFPFLRW